MNPATALARVFADELSRLGVREAVVAPGSRSTPLALALHDDPRIRLHVRIDERSAAYCALGLGKASGRPAVVVCTSGTAAVNLHPAVVEAAEAAVPLLLLTADRPPELRGTGAPQAIDQIKLYGSAVRFFAEVGVPEPVPGMVGYWRSLLSRAWAKSLWDRPGPVHLNVALREPLLPDGDPAWVEPLDGRAAGWTRYHPPAPDPAGPLLPPARRGLLLCGDTGRDARPYVAAATAAGWPVLAEPTSNARFGPNAIAAYRHLLQVPAFTGRHRPDAVVVLGRPGLSRGVLRFLREAPRTAVVSATPDWDDPTRTASAVHAGPPPDRGTAEADPAWLDAWLRADRAARTALDELIEEHTGLSEPLIAREVAGRVPDGGLLFAGASMPIRDLDGHMAPRSGIRVLANRGTNGIDGTVSTAVGAALAHQRSGGGPAYALLGDLSLLYDQNGLVIGPEEPRPDLALVVVDNAGGGIFSTLEQAGDEPARFERLFGTPHGVAPERVAAMAGVPCRSAGTRDELLDALGGTGLRLVAVRTRRDRQARLRALAHERVGAALARTPGITPALSS
ncbi:2-succinyl-5-enolpyruvyl-6-hydroxy-3-cyclohexene-1-carboxylic-acid synthase [Nocardiopsis composta]|uniref:2-succinyl-5-enolpyruvyl-6-hydroxy-3-cyclohexene-1-carboxylate synthase n=1 Tax=Nocardiopsis composta TaxID=157465 RepID=A0A7W8QU11_9ACTN|nr:2-succinyl-5-enolpyruvyl-6-hydroxy-3-cyclohexene-1-carboxylic-acid synthase [Nocardiopsis composta]MBB5436214.1 2-succinyl-5-enolpyruvyl-6-hydroxy-3-cyclohexene-1-carboxylate synthase [Nocardiopsis composta]